MSLGLFQALTISARAMDTQQAGIAVTGNNLANVNNPNYSRQVLDISTSISVPTDIGMEGTGVQATGVQQIVSQALNSQIQSENSTASYWQTQQQALEFAQSDLGQQITSASSSSSDSSQGIASSLSDFFNELQNFSADPSSLSERQVLIGKASTLASQFNQVSQQLGALTSQLNDQLQTDVTNANQLLSDIAGLNQQISTEQIDTNSAPNDLMDMREQKLEDLANLVNFSVSSEANGSLDISIGGVQMVSGFNVTNTLSTYDAGGGQMLVEAGNGQTVTPLTLTGGSMAGEIDARDGSVATLNNNLNTLASQLITAVNTVHETGYGLNGTSKALFFTGSDASDIAVNTALVNDPSLIQASGTKGVTGDNTVALEMAQLANQLNPNLDNQTFGQSYDNTVATLGQSLSSASNEVSDQDTVQQMLSQQRSSISGVSLVEEMGNLSAYQTAYEASAHFMNAIDQMLQILVSLQSS
ncbi:MAG TPA: flagellar hook-associated protein FlgK [Verrucomicrobiae bacterium]|nr:flagellar hook-associated protein FlgK [Verrucomicrobiae bacterium]